MNEYVRLLADFLATGATGINAILTEVPLLGSDTRPSPVTVYDSTRHPWVARATWPTKTGVVTYPAVGVRCVELNYPVGRRTSAAGARQITGSCTLLVQVVVQLQDQDEATEDVGYLTRAVVNSIHAFNDTLSTRTSTTNARLTVATGVRVLLDASEREDNIASAAILASYSIDEATHT